VSEFYDESQRALQDRFDSRRLADRLEDLIVRPTLDPGAIAFVESRAFFFLSTVNESGHPTVSHKGGAPGFVRVPDPGTIVFPSYDGNGMFLSMGNIAGDGRIGMLFIDFESPHRVRVHADAVLVSEGPLLDEFPGADLVVRATVTDTFVNCPRYITRHASAEPAVDVPDEHGDAPVPDWKRYDLFHDVLPERHRESVESAGVISTQPPADPAPDAHDGGAEPG
jgi:predicted pyridoxine 5'-phosphate oxidase superfamily flavin-nucleotide-binding protein